MWKQLHHRTVLFQSTAHPYVLMSEESLAKGRPSRFFGLISCSPLFSEVFLIHRTSRITDNVTFPKECEDLRKENKFLSNEIHMERIMMRTENELTMRNLRNLNQELQAQVKEVHSNTGFIWVSSLYEFHKKKRSVSISKVSVQLDLLQWKLYVSRKYFFLQPSVFTKLQWAKPLFQWRLKTGAVQTILDSEFDSKSEKDVTSQLGRRYCGNKTTPTRKLDKYNSVNVHKNRSNIYH